MRRIRKIIILVIVAFVAVLQGCNKKDDGDKLIETNMNTSSLVETKKTYYRGDEFSPGQTYVNLTYFDKGSNTKWTLKDYTLTSLSTKIEQRWSFLENARAPGSPCPQSAHVTCDVTCLASGK